MYWYCWGCLLDIVSFHGLLLQLAQRPLVAQCCPLVQPHLSSVIASCASVSPISFRSSNVYCFLSPPSFLTCCSLSLTLCPHPPPSTPTKQPSEPVVTYLCSLPGFRAHFLEFLHSKILSPIRIGTHLLVHHFIPAN